MIERGAAFAEFEFKIRITTVGGANAVTGARAFVYATGTTCTYTGTPATQTIAVPYPVTSDVALDIATVVTFSSNDVSATACPLNQLLWYEDK